jgi:hypothetical protein
LIGHPNILAQEQKEKETQREKVAQQKEADKKEKVKKSEEKTISKKEQKVEKDRGLQLKLAQKFTAVGYEEEFERIKIQKKL